MMMMMMNLCLFVSLFSNWNSDTGSQGAPAAILAVRTTDQAPGKTERFCVADRLGLHMPLYYSLDRPY